MNAVVTGTEQRVCEDIATRQQKGVAKYGVTVADNPLSLREWLQHAYEETLDQAIYLRRAIDEMQNFGDQIAEVVRATDEEYQKQGEPTPARGSTPANRVSGGSPEVV